MIEVRDIVEGAMVDLARGIQRDMRARDKNATGGTSRGIEVNAVGGNSFTQGTLIADSQWRYVGSGRGPGMRPPIEPLKKWIAARNLTISAYAVANRIAKEGSRDYRLRNTNVFIDAIDRWEKDFPKVEEKFAQNLVDRTEQIVLQSGLK